MVLLLWQTGCRSRPPKFDGKFWAGDSASSSIMRAQENQSISCASSEFDEYLCMTYADHKKWYETYVLGCERWRSGTPKMTAQEAFDLFVSISEGRVN